MHKHRVVAAAWLGALLSTACAHAGTACPRADSSQTAYSVPGQADAVVVLEPASDPDNPLDLVLYDGADTCRRTVVDKYPVEGSAPAIEAVFPYTVKGQPHLFVIVAWELNHRGIGTLGKLYQVYAYGKNGKGALAPSKLIADRDEMTGVEGMTDGEPSRFPGKNAAEAKTLVNRLGLE